MPGCPRVPVVVSGRRIGDQVAVALHYGVVHRLPPGVRRPQRLAELRAVEHQVAVGLHDEVDQAVVRHQLVVDVELLVRL